MLLRGRSSIQGHSSVTRDICSCDLHRLASYTGWPNLGRRSVTEFFEAGFASTGHGDEAACSCCGLRLAQWPPGTRPFAAHRTLQGGHCAFVGSRDRQDGTTDPRAGVHHEAQQQRRAPTKEVPSTPSSFPEHGSQSRSAIETRVASVPDVVSPVGSQLLAGCLAKPYEELLQQLQPSALRGRLFKNASGAIETRGPLSCGSVRLREEEEEQQQQSHEEANKQELHRLSTLTKWEYSSVVDPRELARAGFYYAGPGDRVQCAFCRGLLRNWERGDRAMALHAEHFTYCRFVQGHDVGNVPIAFSALEQQWSKDRDANFQEGPADDGMGISCSTPKHADLAVETRRLATFATWSPTHRLKPESLAKAGFFYIGRSESVKCFYCDGTISEWPFAAGATDVSCDPWTEHAKCFPTCPYLEQIKGRDFAQQYQTSATSSLAASQQTGFAVDPREIRARMDSPKARILMQMDYPVDLIREVIQKRLATVSDDHTSAEALLADLFATHDDKQQAATAAAHRTDTGGRQHAARLPVVTKSAGLIAAADFAAEAPGASALEQQSNAPDAALPSLSPDNQRMHNGASQQSLVPTQYTKMSSENVMNPEDENRQLKTQLTCKICMDSLVGIVFLPCGHFVCCPACSPALTSCPICRVSIRGTVRTYL